MKNKVNGSSYKLSMWSLFPSLFSHLVEKSLCDWCSSSMFLQSATSASLNSVYFGRLALGIVQLYTILQRKGPFQRHNTSTLLLCATPLLKWIHNKSKWYIMPSFFIVVGRRKNRCYSLKASQKKPCSLKASRKLPYISKASINRPI